MQKIRATKTVSMTEMRDPKKVLEFAAGEKVAVINRGKIVGYFIPAELVEQDEAIATWLEERASQSPR